jgi:hypothetical protein
MRTTTDTNKARQDQLVEALLVYSTIKEASDACGIPYTSARRLVDTPEFLESLRQARMQVYSAALGRLQGLAAEAIKVIEAALKRGDIAVAKYILDKGEAFADADIDRRLSALEASRRGT